MLRDLFKKLAGGPVFPRDNYHVIDGSLSRGEFKLEFRRIRDEFVSQLDREVEGWKVDWARACDEGRPCAWLWDSDELVFRNQAGTLADAKDYLNWAIDDGFQAAFMGAELSKGRLAVWVTHWEDPDGRQRPLWPPGSKVLFQDFINGIGRGTRG